MAGCLGKTRSHFRPDLTLFCKESCAHLGLPPSHGLTGNNRITSCLPTTRPELVTYRCQCRLCLVLVSTPVGLTADLAKRRRLGVIHVVVHRFERFDIGKHGGSILVRHTAVGVPRHDLAELSRPDVPGANRLRKHRLVVVRNPRRVGSDVAAGHTAPRSIENEAASKVHAW